jgi:hypothetical protein
MMYLCEIRQWVQWEHDRRTYSFFIGKFCSTSIFSRRSMNLGAAQRQYLLKHVEALTHG